MFYRDNLARNYKRLDRKKNLDIIEVIGRHYFHQAISPKDNLMNKYLHFNIYFNFQRLKQLNFYNSKHTTIIDHFNIYSNQYRNYQHIYFPVYIVIFNNKIEYMTDFNC